MDSVWMQTLVAVAAVSALSLVGAVTFVLKPQVLQRSLLVLISFAAGALLGDAFIHLLPEIASSPRGFDMQASLSVLAGVIAFFVLEKVLHWHHAHLPSEEVLHPVAWTNLIGDGLHNFVDGTIIAGSFLVSPALGVATAAAVAVHEVPQELGDFGILVHAGLRPRKALALNLLTALAGIAGAVGLLLADRIMDGLAAYLVPFTAGGFVYIASTDLLPELHREPEAKKSMVQLFGLLLGIGLMAALTGLE
jgi:zinc and cadmium transporter